MVLIFVILVSHAVVINAQYNGPMPQNPKGCHLTLRNGLDDIEPKGDPLLLHVSIRIYYLRDVPDSGGSFGADIR